jgi:hypothetical protein
LDEREAVAFEIELHLKSRRRLDQIVRGYRVAGHVKQVIYLCPPGGVLRGVEAAVQRQHVENLVKVQELVRAGGSSAERAMRSRNGT